MSAKPEDFARIVLDAFEQAGRYTDQEVGKAGGPSTTFMTMLRKVRDGEGVMPAPRTDSLYKIERAANWRAGAARRLWNTGEFDAETMQRYSPPIPPEHRRRQSLSLADADRIIQELRDRVLELEERFDVLDQERDTALSAGPARSAPRSMSAVSDTPGDSIAAHEEDASIGGEQAEPDLP